MSHKHYEALREAAIEIAFEAGAITKCEIHEDVYIDNYNDDANKRAYAIASKKLKDKLIDFNRAELLDEIKVVIDEASDKCYECFNDD